MAGSSPGRGFRATAPVGSSWLPPLPDAGRAPARDPDEGASPVNGRLLEGLRRLSSSRHATWPAPLQPERSVHSISCYSRRANERAAEADDDILAHDELEDRKFLMTTSGATGGFFSTEVARSFDSIVAGIDAALAGGEGAKPARIVGKGETVHDTVAARGARHYRIRLPGKPTAVSVTLSRSEGRSVLLWGATTCERPSARNHDYKGKDDKLVYEHILAAQPDDDEEGGPGAGGRRHQAVPTCRDLFVTVEAEAGEVSYALTATFGAVKVSLNRPGEPGEVQKLRRGWEAKLAELRREQGAREQFEEHLKHLLAERQHRNKLRHRGVNYLERNKALAAPWAKHRRGLALKRSRHPRRPQESGSLSARPAA